MSFRAKVEWFARLVKDIDRLGCPCGRRSSASRSRTMASPRSTVAPSWLYRVVRQTARVFKDIERSGCPTEQRSNASRARTIASSRSEPCRSKLVVAITEVNCKASQRDRSLGVGGWAKFQCNTIEDDRLVDVTGPPSLFKLGKERFCE
jgi:hypothetical protein